MKNILNYIYKVIIIIFKSIITYFKGLCNDFIIYIKKHPITSGITGSIIAFIILLCSIPVSLTILILKIILFIVSISAILFILFTLTIVFIIDYNSNIHTYKYISGTLVFIFICLWWFVTGVFIYKIYNGLF